MTYRCGTGYMHGCPVHDQLIDPNIANSGLSCQCMHQSGDAHELYHIDTLGNQVDACKHIGRYSENTPHTSSGQGAEQSEQPMLLPLQVRAAIASQFGQVARSVSATDAAQLLKRPLVMLLKDSTPDVRTALLPGLADILQVRCQLTVTVAAPDPPWLVNLLLYVGGMLLLRLVWLPCKSPTSMDVFVFSHQMLPV